MLSFFKKDIVPRDDDIQNFNKAFKGFNDTVNHAFNQSVQNQNMLIRTLNFYVQAIDSLSIAIWIKDEKDRYITANKMLRKQLFNNHELPYIIGKTDAEIISGQVLENHIQQELNEIHPHELPNIMEYLEQGSRICNLTDLITKAFKKPCLYVETVEKLTLVVYKFPLYDNNCITGTFGYYYDVSDSHDEIFEKVKILDKMDKAYRIDNTDNYYICDFKQPNYFHEKFL